MAEYYYLFFISTCLLSFYTILLSITFYKKGVLKKHPPVFLMYMFYFLSVPFVIYISRYVYINYILGDMDNQLFTYIPYYANIPTYYITILFVGIIYLITIPLAQYSEKKERFHKDVFIFNFFLILYISFISMLIINKDYQGSEKSVIIEKHLNKENIELKCEFCDNKTYYVGNNLNYYHSDISTLLNKKSSFYLNDINIIFYDYFKNELDLKYKNNIKTDELCFEEGGFYSPGYNNIYINSSCIYENDKRQVLGHEYTHFKDYKHQLINPDYRNDRKELLKNIMKHYSLFSKEDIQKVKKEKEEEVYKLMYPFKINNYEKYIENMNLYYLTKSEVLARLGEVIIYNHNNNIDFKNITPEQKAIFNYNFSPWEFMYYNDMDLKLKKEIKYFYIKYIFDFKNN